jgi:hypothetical protein
MNTQSDQRLKLKSFCDNGFDGSRSEAALVLGREAEELEKMLDGQMPIDEDLEMKINGIAEERNIPLDGGSDA